MNALRRNVLKSAAGAGTVAVAVAAGLLKPTQALAGVPRSAFEAKNVGDALKNMGATAPAPAALLRTFLRSAFMGRSPD